MIRRHLWQSFSIAPPIQALRGFPCLGSFYVVLSVRHIEGPLCLRSYSGDQHVRHLKGHPGWGLNSSSVDQALDGPACLLISCQCSRVGRERLWRWLHPLRVTQQCRLASMAAWLSSTGISHHKLLPHILFVHLSSQQQPLPWGCSTIPKLQLLATVPSK